MIPGAEAFMILLHLAGTQCCGTLYDRPGKRTVFTSRRACDDAGERWLTSLLIRRPNDHYECVQVKL